MFIVRCNTCGKKYDYDEYDYCPRCGHENCYEPERYCGEAEDIYDEIYGKSREQEEYEDAYLG
jgi:anaerobic ribonucleoside-triphosphate reductase